MKTEHARIGTVECPECGDRVEQNAEKGIEIGSISESECEEGHRFKVRMGLKTFEVVKEPEPS